ncbi:hypothetical protein Q4I32_004911 [Leishmania shawi]|uniref:Uncharacterized protein n=1 Tax=Leishmania shawi TaxID=5680 RepID=A0AAW3BLG6_9TRYP
MGMFTASLKFLYLSQRVHVQPCNGSETPRSPRPATGPSRGARQPLGTQRSSAPAQPSEHGLSLERGPAPARRRSPHSRLHDAGRHAVHVPRGAAGSPHQSAAGTGCDTFQPRCSSPTPSATHDPAADARVAMHRSAFPTT